MFPPFYRGRASIIITIVRNMFREWGCHSKDSVRDTYQQVQLPQPASTFPSSTSCVQCWFFNCPGGEALLWLQLCSMLPAHTRVRILLLAKRGKCVLYLCLKCKILSQLTIYPLSFCSSTHLICCSIFQSVEKGSIPHWLPTHPYILSGGAQAGQQ